MLPPPVAGVPLALKAPPAGAVESSVTLYVPAAESMPALFVLVTVRPLLGPVVVASKVTAM